MFIIPGLYTKSAEFKYITGLWVILSSFILTIGVLGLIINRNSIPFYLISFETLTLGIIFLLFIEITNYSTHSHEYSAISLVLLTLASVEVSTGLIIMSKFYRTECSLNYNQVLR